ncbi:hypothetical protein ACSSVY_002149 [Roseovarius sp. MBR-51]
MLRLILRGAAVLALLAWGIGYVWISGLACAFGSLSGTCSIPMPWSLRGEDLMILVLMPGAVVAALIGLAYLSGRRAQNSDN